MRKESHRNWLMLITVALFLSLIMIIILKLKNTTTDSLSCIYAGNYYDSGTAIQDYGGRNDCYCNNGNIVCDYTDANFSYDAFTFENISLVYKYLNNIDELQPDYSRIIPVNIDYENNILVVSIERESLCSSTNEAPSQIAYYKMEGSSVVLTILTNSNPTLYTRPCLLSNVFEIRGFVFTGEQPFTILYRNDEGRLFDLGACTYNGSIYGTGDVFQSTEGGICDCSNGVVNCD